jgi:hypothetical protein
MKKKLFLLLAIGVVIINVVIASEKINIKQSRLPYEITSDTIDKNIPVGKYIVEGTILDGNWSINEALIKSPMGKLSQSGKTGKFKILLDTSEHSIIIIKRGFDTVDFCINNRVKNQHRITVVFRPIKVSSKPTSINPPQTINVVEKPVIYAYSDKPISFDLTINPAGKFTFTYPQINENNTWAGLNIDQNGKLTDAKGKLIPYLFWEGVNQSKAFTYKKERSKWVGSVVEQKDIVAFLEKKLNELGLTSIEQTDFITYWGPRMTNYSSCFVQFLVDEEYDQIASIKCTPAPQNCRRVYLLFTGMDNASTQAQTIKQNAVEQHFTSFDRSGFTLLEWGGSELEMDYLKM